MATLLPRAPLGSISIQAWFLACTAIIILVSDALVAIIALVAGLGFRKSTKSQEGTRGSPFRKSGSEREEGIVNYQWHEDGISKLIGR